MSEVKLYQGDCLEIMKELADDSIDSIVTDPPYGLSFMGKDWDYGVPGIPFWKEAIRIAKPGAHILAFGGTRTYHRLACAIEDAGWEIRDCIMWVYGCLSEDTEILTCKGWAKIGTIQIGDKIHAYNRDTKTFRYEAVKDTFLYDYNDTAYRIQSDSTDQLVSRNHRVIVERGGVEVFEYAENLAQEHEACVPVLEGLQGLLDYISMHDERAIGSQQDVFAGMCGGIEAEDTKETLGRPFTEQDMSRLQKGILQASRMAEKGKNELLLGKLQKQGRVCSTSDKTQQGTPNSDNGGAETDFKGKDDRRSESRMERRSDISKPQGKLCECSVCALPEGVSANGTEGWICNGASACSSESIREIAQANGDCSSHQSRPSRQQERESDVILDESCAQIIRDAWRTTTTLARITPVQYKGRMWCVSVSSGAIVARRNGKIFVTGNSGFPKSMDVSKAIAKRAGGDLEAKNAIEFMRARREELGLSRIEFEKRIFGRSDGNVRNWEDGISIPMPGLWTSIKKAMELDETPFDSVMERGDREVSHETGSFGYQKDGERWEAEHVEREVVTDMAKEWAGWGTALKPAVEPIVVARKPLEGTVAANVLKYGTGAINIDGCRVPTEGESVSNHSRSAEAAISKGKYGDGTAQETHQTEGQKLGRFPANLIHDGSDEVLALFPNAGKSSGGGMHAKGVGDNQSGICLGKFSNGKAVDNVGFGDSGSAARFFYCAKASRSERGEGNIHPTVKPISLMRYLVRLVTQNGGVVLDPFMGSGSTGVACLETGHSFIGIEKDERYYSIAKARIEKGQSMPKQGELFNA